MSYHKLAYNTPMETKATNDDTRMLEDSDIPIMPPKQMETISAEVVYVRRGTPSICDDAGIDDDLGMLEDIDIPIMPPKKIEIISAEVVDVRRGTPSICDEEGW